MNSTKTGRVGNFEIHKAGDSYVVRDRRCGTQFPFPQATLYRARFLATRLKSLQLRCGEPEQETEMSQDKINTALLWVIVVLLFSQIHHGQGWF